MVPRAAPRRTAAGLSRLEAPLRYLPRMARNPRAIRPRVTDARRYERALRRVLLAPMFGRLRSRLREATSEGEAQRIMAQVLEGGWLQHRRTPDDEIGERAIRAIEQAIDDMNRWHYGKTVVTFRAAFKVDIRPYLSTPDVRAHMVERISENVDLIRTIPRRAHEGLKEKLRRMLVLEPFDQELMTRVIRQEYGSTGYNLRRIVRDQTNKTIGQLTQLRQTQIGIQSYQWLTSQDERVRPTHIRNSGLVFDWSNPPPVTGHPGHDIQCRCTAIPIVTQAQRQRLAGQSGPTSILPEPSPPRRPPPRPSRRGGSYPARDDPVMRKHLTARTQQALPDDFKVRTVLDDQPSLRQTIADLAKNPPDGYGDQEILAFMKALRGEQRWQVASGAEFRKLKGATWVRGINQRHLVKANMDGTAGVGSGIFGRGQYFARLTKKGAKTSLDADAFGYAGPGGHVVAARVAEDAVIVDIRKMGALFRRFMDDPDVPEFVKAWVRVDEQARFGALIGVDGYTWGKGAPELVILNRSKVVVDSRSLPGGRLYRKYRELDKLRDELTDIEQQLLSSADEYRRKFKKLSFAERSALSDERNELVDKAAKLRDKVDASKWREEVAEEFKKEYLD